MGKQTITLELDDSKANQLAQIARSQEQDTGQVLNQAINHYLEYHEWKTEHIKSGLAQAEAGNFATNEEVDETYNRLLT